MNPLIGKSISQLDTPSLLVDLKKLKKNIQNTATFAHNHNIQLRPHIKTHKSIEIAKLQLEAGAVGITTAKIAEAEIMAKAGIKDILIAYPISSPTKIERLINLLATVSQLKVSVDSLEQIKLLQKHLEKTPYTIEVWIKVNSGLNRCGVKPGKQALELAQAILLLSKLTLGGIFTHAGHSYAATSQQEIEKIALAEAEAVLTSAAVCEKAGIKIKTRSVGSTPTYKMAGAVNGITEVRPGNSVFFDEIQVGLGVTERKNCALTVLASVVGTYKEEGRIILDAGSKTLCLDKGAHGNASVKGHGHINGHSNITIERLSEEHGVATFKEDTALTLNDKVQIIPNHACTVVNQFNEFYVHEDGVIKDCWKVDARGASQ
ncbi:D-TA family PLP-dependent enzyme [Bacillus alkalisoli]|uniref:D-TA family PLP-dependent enzyme n=1 Tax=Bacillus alkalisoli TaxID=2011008 RepID=UPI000C23E7E2|nr:D-TA family PLP-dependent enzyme [Bacillus alkalisoli]